MNYIFSVVLITYLFSMPAFASEESSIENYSYKECLRDFDEENSNMNADDIRSLCKVITEKQQRVYAWDNAKVASANEYTKCYENVLMREKKTGSENPDGIADLECK